MFFVLLFCGVGYADDIKSLQLFNESVQDIEDFYVKPVDNKKLIEYAINGILTSLDPHSSYLNRSEFDDIKVETQGQFGGIGIKVTLGDHCIKVISPIDGTPAAKAKIQPNDCIIKIDGVPVASMKLQAAVDKMRGKKGSKIKLDLIRKHKLISLTLVRDIIKVKSTTVKAINNIAYIRISSFIENAAADIRSALGKMLKDGKVHGMVLDLRNDPGGLLNEAIEVSRIFLHRGEIVSIRGRTKDNNKSFYANATDIARGMPMVVLINGGSASASEIVTGALQDNKRAIVMGAHSFGKGSVQTIIPLKNGDGALRVTTALYYTPSGTSIQAKGIKPDIEVENARVEKISDVLMYSEADLPHHLANYGKNSSKSVEKSHNVVGDYQLSRALDLLNGIILYNKKK